MSASEFRAWRSIYDEVPRDAHGESATADLALDAMVAIADKATYREGDIHDAAREIAGVLPWCFFWPSLAAVICFAIWRFA